MRMSKANEKFEIRVEPVSEEAIVIRIADEIRPEMPGWIRALRNRVSSEFGPVIVDQVPSYGALMIHYRVARENLAKRVEDLRSLCAGVLSSLQKKGMSGEASPVIEIPVCYDSEFALDMSVVADLTGLEPREIIERHHSVTYQVYALGFSPGFAYLGEVDPAIRVQRLKTPRLRIPAGSVGIAEAQTGIYPSDSPAGWRIIGRTPMPMFDSEWTRPNRLEVGERVRFVPLSWHEFHDWSGGETPSKGGGS